MFGLRLNSYFTDGAKIWPLEAILMKSEGHTFLKVASSRYVDTEISKFPANG